MPGAARCVHASHDPARLLLGVRNFSPANFYATQPGGGELGVSTGFGIEALLHIGQLTITTLQIIARCMIPSPVQGWTLQIEAGLSLVFYATNGSAFASPTPYYVLTPRDIGRVLHIVGQMNSTSQVVRLFVNRLKIGADGPCVGYTPHTGQMVIGQYEAANPFVHELIALRTWRGNPTPAQIAAAADEARARGDLTTAMAGATVTHCWPVRTQLRGQRTVDGQAAPSTIVDTVTGAAADELTRTGAPLLSHVDPKVDGRRSYGVQGGSLTSYYETLAGLRGSVGGCWWGFHLQLDQSIGLTARHPFVHAHSDADDAGWDLGSYQLQIILRVRSQAGAWPDAVTYNAALSRPLFIAVCYTGTLFKMWANSAYLGPSAAIAFKPVTAGAMRVGRATGAIINELLDVGRVSGLCGHNTIAPNDAELLAWTAESMAAGRVVNIAGKTQKRWDFTQSTSDNGGPALGPPPVVIERVSGGDSLVRVGTGMSLAQRRERLYGYETTPIARGVSGFSAANSLTATGGPVGSFAGGLHVGVFCRVLAQTTAATRVIAEKRGPSSVGGWSFTTAGMNSTLTFSCYDAANVAKSAPAMSIAAADVGKLLFFAGALEPGTGVVRAWSKRVQSGSGSSPLPNYGVPTQVLTMGQRVGGTFPATDVELLGVVGGENGMTDAELWAWCDALQVKEALDGAPVNKSTWGVDFSSQLTGAVPAQFAELFGGAPITRNGTLVKTDIYNREWSW